jgi:hypothetical protein
MKQPLLSLRWGLVFFALVLAFVTFLVCPPNLKTK